MPPPSKKEGFNTLSIGSSRKMFSPYHTSGFYYAPVTKSLLCATVASTVAINFPLVQYKNIFNSVTEGTIYDKHDFVKYLTSRSVFTDPKDLLCAGILLYHFRIFERRFGSLKFASYVFGSFLLSIALELVLLFTTRQLDIIKLDPMPSGPHGLVFSLFVPYFCDLPRVAIANFMSIPVTGKSLTYLLGLQMSSDSLESTLLALCGILAGLIYRNNILWVQKYLFFPHALGSLCNSALGSIFSTPPPAELNTRMGATLEIQRSVHMEQLERQLIWGQLNNQQRPQVGNFAHGFGGLFRGNHAAAANENLQNHNQPQLPDPPEDQVRQLVDMGFNRDSVLQALRVTNNDANMATNVLLHQT